MTKRLIIGGSDIEKDFRRNSSLPIAITDRKKSDWELDSNTDHESEQKAFKLRKDPTNFQKLRKAIRESSHSLLKARAG